jgi:hypothetical protein
MARKPQAPRTEKPPERKRRMTPDEQHALFIKTARELGVDETGAEFEHAFAKIVAAGPKQNEISRARRK